MNWTRAAFRKELRTKLSSYRLAGSKSRSRNNCTLSSDSRWNILIGKDLVIKWRMLPEVATYLKSKLWQLRFDGEASVELFRQWVSITCASIAAKLC
jgi:hypothetical protein